MYEDVAVSEACAPFVSEVNEGQAYSALAATCPKKRGQLMDPVFNDTFLWSVVPHWLLYQDLAELKKAAE